jgi:diacylglycerol kinase family enzyme
MAVLVLFNPISGAGRALATAQRLAHALEAEGREVGLVPTERRPGEQWLRPRLAGAEALVVVGGDGAVRLSAAEAARAGVPLWHAPTGTENLFARAFGMSRDPRVLIDALRRGATRSIDLGFAGDETFAIMGSIGFDAEVVHALDAVRTGAISHLSYARPILERFGAWRPGPLAWSIDGEREELGPGVVVVGNLPEYGVRLNPAATAVPDDGLLDAVYLPARNALELLHWVPFLRLGLHERHPWLRVRRGRRIDLHAPPGTRLQLDGDPAARPASEDGAIAFRTAPGALRLLLPRDAG